MARIRTIKPDFVESENIGRCSREARLLFLQLFLIADDSGRARAASRMLASHLYPFDEDAGSLLDGWLDELEAQGCIRRYEVDGSHYLDIPNWLKHQRIDKPSPSKLPEYSTKPPGGLGEASSTPRAERKGKEGRGPDRKGGEGTRPERKESRETEIEATAPPTPRSFADARSANGGSPDPNNRLLSDEELMALPLEQRRAYCRKLAEMPTPPEVSQ